VTSNQGWISDGTDHDTAEFDDGNERRWWAKMGSKSYPGAGELLILADGGAVTGSRSKLWKVRYKSLRRDCHRYIGLPIFRPAPASGTRSTSNVLSYHGKLARQTPGSHEVIVNLIGNTDTQKD